MSGSSDVKVYKSHAFKAWALGLPEVHSGRATLQNAWRKIGSHQKTAEKQWLFWVLSRQSYCLLETRKTGESFAMLVKHMGNNTVTVPGIPIKLSLKLSHILTSSAELEPDCISWF